MTARRAVVTGRVQGVGFRFFAERAATELGLRGWVRNLPDGSVETVVEGEDEAVTHYLARISRGPRSSRVDAVAVEDLSAQDLPGFEITG